MAEFSFSIPQNVVFGAGSLAKLPEVAKKLDKKKGFIISGPHLTKIGMVGKCKDALLAEGILCETFSETEGNPGVETVEKAAVLFKACEADFIIAFGGGSPLDVAKAVAVVATYGGSITEYEGGGKVPGPVVPMIAIPTTAGTGSEVTSFSVITDHSRNYKLTVSSEYLLPKYAILDSDLITTVPLNTAAACGADAMIHALESYVSLAASPFSEMFSLVALELIGKSLRRYVANRKDKVAAENMMLGSLFAGIAFTHARLGNVHAMSHPVSAYFDVAHGLANAIILPAVVEFNCLCDSGKYYKIYKSIAPYPVKEEEFTTDMLANEIRMMFVELGIPLSLSAVGVKEEYFDAMAEDAMKSGNILVNPRMTTKEDIIELYKKSF